MALLTKPITEALKNRDACKTEAERWDRKAHTMRTEADQLEATAIDSILADESAAELITLKVNTLQRKAQAFDKAAQQARVKAYMAAREVLRVEADELDKESAKQDKAADKHELEVAKAKAVLESLDECQYTRLVEESDWDAVDGKYRTRTYHHGKAAGIKQSAKLLTTQAQVIRYWLEHGQLPNSLKDLNEAFEPIHDVTGSWATGAPIDKYGDPITENLREAMASDTSAEGE